MTFDHACSYFEMDTQPADSLTEKELRRESARCRSWIYSLFGENDQLRKRNLVGICLRKTSSSKKMLLIISFVILSSIFQDIRELFIHPAAERSRNTGVISYADASTTKSKTNRMCNGDMSFEKEIMGFKFIHASASPSPVKFRFLRRNYARNFPFKVVISIEGESLLNTFFIQAHDLDSNRPIGKFNSTYSDKDITTISCGSGEGEMDTAVGDTTNYRRRSKVVLYWDPPSNFSKTVVFRVNAQTSDQPISGWRGLTSDEILPKTKECVSGDGSGYRGTQSHTKSGLSCQRWDSQTPNRHEFQSKKGLISNFCRKPNENDGPWCFSTSTDTKDEACDIPKCVDDKNLGNFIEFGETVGDTKLKRNASHVGRLNFTSQFPMIKANYTSVAVFEDGVLVMGKDSQSLDGIHLHANGSFFTEKDISLKAQSTAIIAPFWTNIRRRPPSIGCGYVFFRESSEPDVVTIVGDIINENLKAKSENAKKTFHPTWTFIATWHLVGGDAFDTDAENLNSFQAVLATDGNRSFVLFNYNMNKWTEQKHSALVGYKSGDGIRFLNHSLPNTNIAELEAASSLARAITSQSNVKRPGQMMYEVSMCNRQQAGTRSPPCQDSLTLRLKAPVPKQQSSRVRTPRRSDANVNACGGSDCGDHGTCDLHTDVCVCEPGFTGEECDVDVDECGSSPCQNGGNCTDKIDSYACTCREGYTGSRCEDDINDCFNSPCKNGGRCEDEVNGYRCICVLGYTGRNCEKLLDQCASTPCKNGGICNSTNDGYICQCVEGYSGQQCQIHDCFDGRRCEKSESCIDKETGRLNCTCQGNKLTDQYCQQAPTTQPLACPPGVTGSVQSGFISWPETGDGNIAISPCPTPTTGDVTRRCNGSLWEDPDTSSCGTLSLRSIELDRLANSVVVAANASEVASQLVNVTASEPDRLVAYDISKTAQILAQIVEVVGSEIDLGAGNDVITCVSNVMEAPSEEMRVASMVFSSNSRLLEVVDEVLLKLTVSPNQNVYVQSRNIKVGVSGINPDDVFTGKSFALSADLQPIISSLEETSTSSASISLPPSIMDYVAPGTLTRVQFATYTSTSLFDHVRTDPESTEAWKVAANFTLYTDYVVSASVGASKLTGLEDKVTITIPRSNSYFGNGPYCVFYQFLTDGGEGNWASQGCRLRENTTRGVVCECDHLTNFAAILDVYGTVEYLDEYTKMLLRILTYIGCGLSIFGLFSTLVSYTMFQKIRKEAPAKILISLCVALMAVNIVYLCLQSAYYSSPKACVAVAAIMHYALLSSLTWMALEAVNMYIALVKVFNTYYRRYMLKMSLIGWGLPLLIVLATFIVQFATGVPSYEMNSLTEICWLRREVFYGTLVAPFGIIFLLNTVIYCLVLAQLLGMSSRKLKHMDSARKMRKPAKRENIRKLRGAVGLMALLGISWGFALGTIDKAALTFAYIFVVFNSSQGFWVFIFHCVLKKEVSKSWKKLLFNKGKGFRDGSSRWSRFSSSNTRGSRSTSTTSTARSISASSMKTSYMVPRTSRSVSRSEASIGMDSKGLDVVTRTNSNGYANPVFEEPSDIGDPPPYPPPPIPPSEERTVRRVPKKHDPGPLTTIATQTDSRLIGSHDTDSQHSAGSDINSETYQSNEEDERRDSVDTNFGSRGFRHPFHREVVLSPSNESGIYSDASVASNVQPVESARFVGVENAKQLEPQRRERREREHGATNGSGVTNELSASPADKQFYGKVKTGRLLSNDLQCTDSGISIASGVNSDESPPTGRSQNGRPELQAQDSRSSLYSNYSNTSSVSAPSTASENLTNQNPPSPHLWKAPLVIKRSENHGNSIFSDSNIPSKPVATSPQGATKRALWKKHRKPAHSVDETDNKVPNISPARRRARRKLPKSQSLDEDSQTNSDVATNFVLSRGNSHDGAL